MFIDEQMQHWEFRYSLLRDEFIERLVWCPVSNRHCCWTFKPNPYGKRLWG